MKKLVNLDTIRGTYLEKIKNLKRRIIVCAGTGCVANGSKEVYEEFINELKNNNLDVIVEVSFEKENDGILLSESGCQGFCQMGPLVTILPDKIFNLKFKFSNVKDI